VDGGGPPTSPPTSTCWLAPTTARASRRPIPSASPSHGHAGTSRSCCGHSVAGRGRDVADRQTCAL